MVKSFMNKEKLLEEIEIDKLFNHWINSSDSDYKTMNDLFSTKNYSWALFIGHLVIEKLLKAYYIKTKFEIPPFIHDLRRLAEKADLHLNKENINILDTVTRFNINARYDDYKNNFNKLCTLEFTAKWISNIKEFRRWIKSLL